MWPTVDDYTDEQELDEYGQPKRKPQPPPPPAQQPERVGAPLGGETPAPTPETAAVPKTQPTAQLTAGQPQPQSTYDPSQSPMPTSPYGTKPLAPRPMQEKAAELQAQGPPKYHGLKKVFDTLAGATTIGSAIEQAGGFGTQGYGARLAQAERNAAQEAGNIRGTQAEELGNATTDEREAQAEYNRAHAKAEANAQPKVTHESAQQGYAAAVQDAIGRGADPATDPTVQKWADAITSLQKEPGASATKDKQDFQATLRKAIAALPPNAKPEAFADEKQVKAMIQNSTALSPEEKQSAIAYMITNPTAATQTTRMEVLVGPRWASVGLQKTALDEKIAKDTGRLPTEDIRQRGQFSAELLPHLPVLRDMVEEADSRGLLGPLMGRGVEFMEGKLGTTGDPDTDRFYSNFRTNLKLWASGMNRAHFGGRAGADTLKYFTDMIGGAFRSKEAIEGTLDASSDYLRTYAGAASGFGQPVNFNGEPSEATYPGLNPPQEPPRAKPKTTGAPKEPSKGDRRQSRKDSHWEEFDGESWQRIKPPQ